MRVFNFVVTWFLLCLSESSGKRIPTFAGPYRTLISKIGNVSDEIKSSGKFWVRLHATQARGKQLQYGWGYAYAPIPLRDDIKIAITMAVRANNQWKKNAFIFNFEHVCTTLHVHVPAILPLLYGPDHDLNCPIKPIGLKEIKNQSFDLVFPKFPVLPYGRYLHTVALYKGREIIGVGVSDVELVPRL